MRAFDLLVSTLIIEDRRFELQGVVCKTQFRAQFQLNQIFCIELAQICIKGAVSIETTGLVASRQTRIEHFAIIRKVLQGYAPAPKVFLRVKRHRLRIIIAGVSLFQSQTRTELPLVGDGGIQLGKYSQVSEVKFTVEV